MTRFEMATKTSRSVALWISTALVAASQSLAQESAPARPDIRTAQAELNGNASPDMKQIGKTATGILGRRETAKIQVELDGPGCYRFAAQGGRGVNDLSLVVSANGKEVAGDRISGKHPVAQWCPSDRTKFEIALKMYDGSGPYEFRVYGIEVDPSGAKQVGSTDNDFIAIRVRQLHAQMGEGRAAVTPLLRGGLLAAGAQQSFPIRLTAGHCYTVIAVGNPSVLNLDLSIVDPQGREVRRDATDSNFIALELDPCVPSTGRYEIKVQLISGTGAFGVQVFSD